MKVDGLLPVGSIVLLEGGNHRIMIMGYCQQLMSDTTHIFDYVGCLFPEGYIGADQNFLFDRDQIAKVYHVGYQTDGQFAFVEKMEETIARLSGKAGQE